MPKDCIDYTCLSGLNIALQAYMFIWLTGYPRLYKTHLSVLLAIRQLDQQFKLSRALIIRQRLFPA